MKFCLFFIKPYGFVVLFFDYVIAFFNFLLKKGPFRYNDFDFTCKEIILRYTFFNFPYKEMPFRYNPFCLAYKGIALRCAFSPFSLINLHPRYTETANCVAIRCAYLFVLTICRKQFLKRIAGVKLL